MMHRGILLFTEDAAISTDRRVAGLSLLDRGIRTMARTGLQHLTVVVPADAPLKLTRLTRKLDLTIEFLTWKSASTLSLVADEDLLLLLGDHVHHHASLTDLVDGGLAGNDLIVQTSPPPDYSGTCHQVTLPSIGVTFTAKRDSSGPVSTGAFLCSSGLFARADLAAAGADFHAWLQDLCASGKVAERPADPPLWQPVHDRRSARAAKGMLFSQVTKKTSGFISRHLNARISIPTSKLLIETGMSPHLITVLLVLTTGLTSAYLISFADDYPRLALAGLLWQLAAILDRCDGEVARVKLCESKFGAWFDTVTDNFAYICAYAGLVLGIRRLYPATPLYWYLGVSAIASLLLTLFILYTYAHRTGSGSLQHYLRDLGRDLPDSEKSWIQRWMQRYGFISKRDFFSFFIFLAAIANHIEVAYCFLVTIAHLALGAVLLSQRKMLSKTKGETGSAASTLRAEEQR